MKRFFQRVEQKARNVTLPAVSIVAFGDSVTQGVMEHQMLDSKHVYHRLLQEELESFFPTTTFSTFNAGVSGDNVPNALARLDRDVLNRNPDLVLVAFGLNDSQMGVAGLEKFSKGLRAIVFSIKKETDAGILLLTPPFMATRQNARIHPTQLAMTKDIVETQNKGILALYAEAIREVANSFDIPLADIHKEWIRLAYYGIDTNILLINGLNHPDARGHRFASQIVFHRILSERERLQTIA